MGNSQNVPQTAVCGSQPPKTPLRIPPVPEPPKPAHSFSRRQGRRSGAHENRTRHIRQLRNTPTSVIPPSSTPLTTVYPHPNNDPSPYTISELHSNFAAARYKEEVALVSLVKRASDLQLENVSLRAAKSNLEEKLRLLKAENSERSAPEDPAAQELARISAYNEGFSVGLTVTTSQLRDRDRQLVELTAQLAEVSAQLRTMRANAASTLTETETKVFDHDRQLAELMAQLAAARTNAASTLTETETIVRNHDRQLVEKTMQLAAMHANAVFTLTETETKMRDRDRQLAELMAQLEAARTNAASTLTETETKMRDRDRQLAELMAQLEAARTAISLAEPRLVRVRGLPPDFAPSAIRGTVFALFESYSPSLIIVPPEPYDRGMPVAIATFSSTGDAEAVIRGFHGISLFGRRIDVEFTTEAIELKMLALVLGPRR